MGKDFFSKKKFYLTLDLEDWYHLDYFKDKVNKKPIFISELKEFFNFLDEKQIKITIFALAELVEKYPEFIKELAEKGHEIACHGLNHDVLFNKSNQQFKDELIKAKKIIEDITNKPVYGYRAPCFSLDNEKLEILQGIGLKYDSSYIKFSQHSLYRNLDLSEYDEVDDLIYKKGDFFEFEVPMFKVKKYNAKVKGIAIVLELYCMY